MDLNKLKRKVIIRCAMALAVLAAMLFISAGTFLYWEAWLYIAVLILPMIFVMIYFLKHNPALLEKRMKMKEKVPQQFLIMKFSYLYFILVFIIPGLDRRYDWSHVPSAIVIATDIFFFSGYILFVRVLMENRYASRIIEVEEDQKVIMTGPYVVVRHPMYLATLIMYILTPVALGSYWALIPALFVVPIIVARLLNEEKILKKELKGYQEYTEKTKYRLIPGVW